MTPPSPPVGPLDTFRPTRRAPDPSRPSRMALLPIPSLWEGLPTPTGPSVWLPNPSRPSGRASRPLLEALKTPLCPPEGPAAPSDLSERPANPPISLGGPLDPSQPPGRAPNCTRSSGRASWRPLPSLRVLQEGLPTPPGPPLGPPNLSQLSKRASQPIPTLQVGLPTSRGPRRGPSNPSWSSWRDSRPSGRASLPTGRTARHSKMASRPSEKASRPLLTLRGVSRPLTALQEGLLTPLSPPGGTPDPSGGPANLTRNSEMAS